jgi:hypothetical protein
VVTVASTPVYSFLKIFYIIMYLITILVCIIVIIVICNNNDNLLLIDDFYYIINNFPHDIQPYIRYFLNNTVQTLLDTLNFYIKNNCSVNKHIFDPFEITKYYSSDCVIVMVCHVPIAIFWLVLILYIKLKNIIISINNKIINFMNKPKLYSSKKPWYSLLVYSPYLGASAFGSLSNSTGQASGSSASPPSLGGYDKAQEEEDEIPGLGNLPTDLEELNKLQPFEPLITNRSFSPDYSIDRYKLSSGRDGLIRDGFLNPNIATAIKDQIDSLHPNDSNLFGSSSNLNKNYHKTEESLEKTNPYNESSIYDEPLSSGNHNIFKTINYKIPAQMQQKSCPKNSSPLKIEDIYLKNEAQSTPPKALQQGQHPVLDALNQSIQYDNN